MSEYDNRNRGAIWRFTPKEAADPNKNYPDFSGNLDVEGVKYRISAWKRRSDEPNNRPALRFTIQRDEKKPAARIGKDYQQQESGEVASNIPF